DGRGSSSPPSTSAARLWTDGGCPQPSKKTKPKSTRRWQCELKREPMVNNCADPFQCTEFNEGADLAPLDPEPMEPAPAPAIRSAPTAQELFPDPAERENHIPRLELPTDRRRPASRTFECASLPLALSPDLSDALRTL